jgi:methylated-DNA-protein-cysteine methyltransferase related protein
VAVLAGLEGHARQVGYALHALPPKAGLPWHRVINARGTISARRGSDWGELQRLLLEGEGIRFDRDGRVDLERFRWRKRMKDEG